MGSSSSVPTRIILSEEEAKAIVQSDKQTPEDSLSVPVTEKHYPEVKPPPSTRMKRQPNDDVYSAHKSIRLSGRYNHLPDIIESTENVNKNVLKDTTATGLNPVDTPTSLATEEPAPNHRPGTPATIQLTRARQGYPLSTWPPRNMLRKGLTTMSVLHKREESLPGSVISSRIFNFNDVHLRLDTESRRSMAKREIMLLEREKYEYQQLLSLEAFHSLPERSPRVQAPTNLAKALAALKNPDQFTCDSLKDMDYTEAEQKATEHKDHKAATYEALMRDITSSLQNDALKVWAILAWISKQAIGRISFGSKVFNTDTPNGYMQLIQENKGTYPVFFALLCRAAGIQCVVVHGISKSSNYELGSDNVDDLRSSWNSVYVEGGWRLVHPLWVCRSLRGHQQGGWLTIEKDGQASRKLYKEQKGTDVVTFNSYYVFIDPKEFIYRNFPDDPQWQLLKEPWSKEEFINGAYLRPEFFKRKLNLLSDNKCVLVSTDGEPCNVVLGFGHENASDMVFKYDFSIRVDETPDLLKGVKRDGTRENSIARNESTTVDNNDQNVEDKTFLTRNNSISETDESKKQNVKESNADLDAQSTMSNNLQLSENKANRDLVKAIIKERHANLHNFVAVFKEKDTVRFEIRFLRQNTYRLRIFGGLFTVHGSEPPCIMEVKLDCLANVTEPKPLPFDPGIVGWGPGPVAENLGLFVPSHENGVIEVSNDEETVVQFILKRMVQVEVDMYQAETTKTSLSKFVHYKIIELKDTYELRIVILYPGKGEYAIKIDVFSNNTNLMENACNFLVKTGVERPHEEYYTRKARKMLLEAMLDVDVCAMEGAVEACKQCGLPEHDPEFRGGKNRLEFLQSRKALKDCLLVKRIDVVEQAILRAKTARFCVLVSRDIRKAERHLEDICDLNEGGWNNHVPEIDRQSLFEMCRLRKPKEEIYQTMKAVYILLGVDSSEVQKWNQIQLLMRKGEATIVEMARLEKYLEVDEVEILSPGEEALDEVSEIVTTYAEEEVRKIDNTAAAYYQWVVDTLSKLKQHLRRKTKTNGQNDKLDNENDSQMIRTQDISKVNQESTTSKHKKGKLKESIVELDHEKDNQPLAASKPNQNLTSSQRKKNKLNEQNNKLDDRNDSRVTASAAISKTIQELTPSQRKDNKLKDKSDKLESENGSRMLHFSAGSKSNQERNPN